MVGFVDAVALAIFSLEFAHFLSSFLLPSKPGQSINGLKRGYRWVDQALDFRLAQIAWLCFDYLVLRLIVLAWLTPQISVAWAVVCTAALVGLCFALLYPISVAWSALITPWCEAKAVGHDLQKTLSSHKDLSDNWQPLAQEYVRVTHGFGRLPSIGDVLSDVALTTVNEAVAERADLQGPPRWTTIFLRLGARDFKATLRHFPLLASLIANPRIVGALFSCLEPGVELKPHRGYFKGVLRYHLCLRVSEPESVWLVVDGQRYHWRAGEAVVFDDMYVHSAHNLSSQPRLVLFMDVLRPLPTVLDGINHWIARYSGRHPVSRLIENKVNAWVPPYDHVSPP